MPVGYTPIYKISKDNVDITSNFNDRTTEIHVQLMGGGGQSDTCSITLDDRDWRLGRPQPGARLTVELGYREVGLAVQGIFEINQIEFLGPPRSMKITGSSIGFMGALKAPAFQAHENRTLGDIIAEIAGKGGATAAVDPSLAGEKIPYFNQTMSPLHMLAELERRFGALAKFEMGKLVFKPRNNGDSYSGKLLPTLLLEPFHLAQWSVRESERTSYRSSKAAYKDQNGATKWVEAINPTFKSEAAGDPPIYRYGKHTNSEAEARAMAKSIMESLQREQVEANFTLAKGDPWVRDQMPIYIRNMRDGIDGSFVSQIVTHTFTKDPGIITMIQANTPSTEDSFGRGLTEDRLINPSKL